MGERERSVLGSWGRCIVALVSFPRMRRRPGDGRGWWWAQRALPAAWAVLALAAVALRRTATSELASISPASARWAQGAVADEAFLDSQQKSSRGELTGEGDPADRREAVHRQHEFRRSFTHGDTESSLVRTIPGKSGARRPLIAPVRWPTYRRGPDDGGSFVNMHVVQGASSSSLSNDYEQKTGWKGEFFDMTKCKHSLSYLVCHMDDDKEVIDLLTTLSLSCARKHPPTRASLNKQGRWKKGQVKDIKKLPTFAEMEGKSPSKTEESQEVDFNDGSFAKLGFNDKFFARWTGVLRIKRAGVLRPRAVRVPPCSPGDVPLIYQMSRHSLQELTRSGRVATTAPTCSLATIRLWTMMGCTAYSAVRAP